MVRKTSTPSCLWLCVGSLPDAKDSVSRRSPARAPGLIAQAISCCELAVQLPQQRLVHPRSTSILPPPWITGHASFGPGFAWSPLHPRCLPIALVFPRCLNYQQRHQKRLLWMCFLQHIQRPPSWINWPTPPHPCLDVKNIVKSTWPRILSSCTTSQ